jgi:hypothetical protein
MVSIEVWHIMHEKEYRLRIQAHESVPRIFFLKAGDIAMTERNQ